MSFLLRLISASAAGREIVRTRRVDADALTIGRDPASDIHLTDLEVVRHHATIRRVGPQQLVIEAIAGLPFLVDGRSVQRADIDAGRGGEIRIGQVRIAIALGEEPGTIGVTVARVEAMASEEAAERRFSLRGVALPKRPTAWALAVAVLALFLAWPIWSFTHQSAKLTAQQMASGRYSHVDASWSAGPLSAAHASLAGDCKACHVGAFVAVPDKACKACHVGVADHADPHRQLMARAPMSGVKGLEQKIAMAFGRDPGRCVDCHVEHQGAKEMPKTAQAFCTDCHANLKDRLPDTKLADAGDFAAAHPQFAPTVMSRPGDYPRFTRVSLDARPRQDTGLKFTHAEHMSRTNGVARMQQALGRAPLDCAGCHVPDDSGARFKPVSMERNCQSCHSLAFDRVGDTVRTLRHGEPEQVIADIRDFYAAHPGGVSFVPTTRARPGAAGQPGYLGGTGGRGSAAAAIRAVFSKGGACYDCHVVIPPKDGGLGYRVVPVKQTMRYLNHGWFDHAAHATTSCATCHGEATTSNDTHAVMIPGIKTCRTCHGGDTAAAPLVKSSCVMCHDYHRDDGAPHAKGTASAGTTLDPALRPDGRRRGDADRADLGPAHRVRPG